jgi:predicted PurR-regulated permease PerM
VITWSLTWLAAAVLLMVASVAVLAVLRGLAFFVHIVGPVIVAFFLSLLTRPWYQWLRVRCGGRDGLALVFFALSFLLPMVMLGWLLGAFLLEQWVSLSVSLPGQLNALYEKVQGACPELGAWLFSILPEPEMATETNIFSLVGHVLGAGIHLGETLFSVGTATLLWLLTFFYWMIFVMQPPLSAERFASMVPFLSKERRASVAMYFRNFTEIMESYFRGQIIDVLIQGVLYGLIFQVLGLPNGFIIGFVLGLLNLAPYIGVITGLCVTLPLAMVHGGVGFMVLIFVVFCVIQTFDGYVMQPYIQGKRMRLSAWQIVFALLFWTKLGGFLGLLLAIPLTAFVKASWRKLRDGADRFVSNDRLQEEV